MGAGGDGHILPVCWGFFFTPINKIDFLLLNLNDLASVAHAPGIRE